jgi:hypothetical protein
VPELIIGARFNGPADSGNGGYTAGLVASCLPVAADQTAQVTLRVPPPLDTPLRVAPAGGGLEVYAGARLIAEAVPVRLDGDPPGFPVSYPEAAAATPGYPGFVDHPFPTCYVCGPERATGDGLRIFPGPLPDGRTAAPWLVPQGCSATTVWAALDCPGGWAIMSNDPAAGDPRARQLTPRAPTGRPYVLGRMAARVHAVPPPGARCVVLGEVVATEGRKAQVRTALYQDHPGSLHPVGLRLLAQAHSTWIAI